MSRSFVRPARVHWILLLLLGGALVPVEAQAPPRRLTLEEASGRGGGVRFSARPAAVRWAPDGVHLQLDGQWLDPLTRETVERPEREETPAPDWRRPLRDRLAALDGVDEDAARQAVRRAQRSEGGDAHLVTLDDDLYFQRGDGAARRLTRDGAAKLGVELSPDGEAAAYVQRGDLYVVDTETDRVQRVTRGGSDELLHGRLDWVYQEEIYGRGNFKGFWWSPDSRHVVFLRLDESAVDEFTVVDHIEFPLKTEVTRYPKAGSPNPTVGVGVVDADGGGLVWFDLSAYDPDEEILVVRVGWTPAGDRAIFAVQNRIQTWMELCYGDPDTGRVTPILKETSDSWVNRPRPPRWLEDGTFLWLSDRTGYRHIYHYEADGTLIRPITVGRWAVRAIEEVNEEKGFIQFDATKDGAINRHSYEVKLDGSDLRALTRDAGSHRITFNHDRSLYLDRYSSVDTPPCVRLVRTSDREVLTTWESEIPELEEYGYSRPELIKVPARDGFPLDAMLIRPSDFDETRRYGVWLTTYSGPNSPSVRNRWSSAAWDQFLAQQGFLVFRVNVRSASGRGQATTAACYRQLGVQELRDLEDAVKWLCRKPWADGDRVGITGWSYGGFMAAYALTHSSLFRLGVAGAGVYDWRCYDTIYTERYMSTPQRNPGGYEITSCTGAAKDLQGHLVLVHGTMDDNVHMQNVMQFVYELQKAGKDFDLMLYPRSRHGVGHPEQRWHLRRLTWNAIQRHLGAAL